MSLILVVLVCNFNLLAYHSNLLGYGGISHTLLYITKKSFESISKKLSNKKTLIKTSSYKLQKLVVYLEELTCLLRVSILHYLKRMSSHKLMLNSYRQFF